MLSTSCEGRLANTQLTADARNTVWFMLEAMGGLLAKRLRNEFKKGPVDMGAVLEIVERLRWVASEANRLR